MKTLPAIREVQAVAVRQCKRHPNRPLTEAQIRALYQLKLQRKRSMTKLIREAVDRYLKHVCRQTSVPRISR